MRLLALAALFALGPAVAQQPAERPMRFVVPFPPAGATDIVARILAGELTTLRGQQVIIDNRAGASGNIGAEIVARSTPDGRTLLMSTTGVLAVNQSLFAKLPYDPEKDFAPVALSTTLPLILIVPATLPYASVGDVIAAARAKSGQLSFASSGAGATTHVAGELFKALAKVDILHVPYKGGGQLLNDLIAGHVTMSFFQIPGAIQHVRAGRLKALAISTAKRSTLLPELPSIAEAGVPGYEALAWSGVSVAARTPRALIDRLSRELERIHRDPSVRERLAALGAESAWTTPEDFGNYVRSERAKWSRVLRDVGVKPQ